MEILAISGSLKAASSNTFILEAMISFAPKHCTVNLFKNLADIPAFNPDLDNDTPPGPVLHFRKALREADGVIFCTPEYAFNVPGALKNSLDWIVSSGELVDKPTVVISASPLYLGGDKANAALVTTLGALSAKIPEKGILTVPNVSKKLNDNGEVIDKELAGHLKILMYSLRESIKHI